MYEYAALPSGTFMHTNACVCVCVYIYIYIYIYAHKCLNTKKHIMPHKLIQTNITCICAYAGAYAGRCT